MKSQLIQTGLLWSATVALVAAVAGCSGGDGGSEAAGSSNNPPPNGPTYYRDVKAILDAKCTGCHVEGGIAPFPLTTYADAKANKDGITGAISQGVMPPWPPAQGCTDYLDDRSLTADQSAAITSWVKAGALEGDPKDAPAEQKASGGLSRVDLTLSMPTPYTPTKSPDDYRCFMVDWPAQTTTYVTGFGVEAGTPAIVHHVIAYLIQPADVASYQALDDAEPGPGYTCFGGPGGGTNVSWIGGWAPGALGSDFPAGTGIEIAPGSKVVLQVHYNTSTSAPVPDVSKVVLKTDATVAKKAIVMPWTNPQWVIAKTMTIAAHATDATYNWGIDPSPYLGTVSKGVLTSNQPYTIYSAGLHMHTRGTRAITKIQRQGGTDECMLDIEHWNFHWQGSYGFTQPKQVNPGDKLYLECHWNNPDAVDVNWGEGTGDEMCLGTYFVTQ